MAGGREGSSAGTDGRYAAQSFTSCVAVYHTTASCILYSSRSRGMRGSFGGGASDSQELINGINGALARINLFGETFILGKTI